MSSKLKFKQYLIKSIYLKLFDTIIIIVYNTYIDIIKIFM